MTADSQRIQDDIENLSGQAIIGENGKEIFSFKKTSLFAWVFT
jgi:hypothetical protein